MHGQPTIKNSCVVTYKNSFFLVYIYIYTHITGIANMIDTLVYMAEQLIPEDNPQDDTDHHKNIRRLTEQTI
jgi:hypothetical protein